MAVYLDDFFIRLMKEIWTILKIDIFSETISPGRTHFAIWDIKHYNNSTDWLLVWIC